MTEMPYIFTEWEPVSERAMIHRAIQPVHDAREGGPRFNAIRALYDLAMPRIAKMPHHRWAFDPSAWADEWTVGTALFTPIEYQFFQEMRMRGVVMYPQFPVGRYFVDFGHPGPKVAVECDGRAYHRDRDRDERREAEIRALGWTVFRLPGSDCFKLWTPEDAFDSEYEANEFRRECREQDIPQWRSGEYDPCTSLVMMLDAVYDIGPNGVALSTYNDRENEYDD